MDYVFSSNKESIHENLDSNHDDQEASLFGQFPLPSLDEISTRAIVLQNNHHSADRWKSSPTKDVPSKTKRVRKKRSTGKKDRHSKIHTAQGLRDRRMRLSLHIARKFFGLQDMLGFDKASKTIEWLFSNSKKAIEQVMAEARNSQNTDQSVLKEINNERCDQSPFSDSVVDSDTDYDAASNKGKQLMKLTESDVLARGLRDKARARARERTRERMMIEKSKQMFGANPNYDVNQLQVLGFSVNPNNQYDIEKSSSSPLEYSDTHQFLDQQAQLDGIAQKTEDHMGTTATSSSPYFSGFCYNKNLANPPPAGWLNSSNTFLGFLEGWDSELLRMASENYGILPNTAASLTGDIHEQSLTSVIVHHTDLLHFQSQQ